MMVYVSFPEYTIKQDGYDSVPCIWFGVWKFEQSRMWNGIPQAVLSIDYTFENIVRLCNISKEDQVILRLKYGIK